MKDFLKKYNSWVSMVVFLIVVVLAVFFVISPLRKDMQANADDIQKKIIDENLDKSRIAKIPEMEKAEAVFSENRNNLDITLSGDNEVDFIKRIEALADETNNKVSLKVEDDKLPGQNVPAAKKDPNDIKSNLAYTNYLSLQISLEGGYAEALNFIHKLENMGYYVNVISLNMTKGDPTETKAASTVPASVKSGGLFPDTLPQPSPQDVKKVLKTNLEVVVYLK